MGHEVRRVREVKVERVGAVREVRAVGVEGPLPGLGRAELAQALRHPDAWRAELGLGQARYGSWRDRDTEPLGELLGAIDARGVSGFFGFEAPRPEGPPIGHVPVLPIAAAIAAAAAATPEPPTGAPIASRAASIVPSVPSTIGGLTCPMCPIRNARPSNGCSAMPR